MVWTHRSFLVKCIRSHKIIENACCTFDKEKGLLKQKKTCQHHFLECYKHIKGPLKDNEFASKFGGCNFENIRIYFNQ